MNGELHDQIFSNLNLKDTDELLDIWQTNDRVDWTDSAFEAIKQILAKRGVELPEQDEPILEHFGEDEIIERYKLSEEEVAIIEDNNPPLFYDPFDVVIMSKRLNIAAIAYVILLLISSLLRFDELENIARSYTQSVPGLEGLVFPLTLFSVILGVALASITTYYPLKALSHILRILMEMEFKSRNG